MRENDTATPKLLDAAVALALLTRLPLPRLPDHAFDQHARVVWAFPIAGCVVGAIAAAIGAGALALGAPIWIAAGLVLTTQIIITGALHEDGLADTADGFWGAWTVERRLEIMKDSRIGTYGVLALVLSVGLRWAALTSVMGVSVWAVVAVAVASRLNLPVVMRHLPRARPGGLSDRVGQPPMRSVGMAVVLGLLLLAPTIGADMAPVLLAVVLATGLCVAVARAKIGGQTGDVLGATQQVTEIFCLVALSMALGA